MHRRQFLISSAASAAVLHGGVAHAMAPGKGELRDDITIVRRALALHPGLHRYLTAAEVEAGLARLAAEWDASDAAIDATAVRYLSLQRFLSSVRCGHTHCNFHNQSDAVAGALFDRSTRLPFAFAWLDGRMVVIPSANADPALPPGTRILAIDGRKPSAMLAGLMPYARADGHNDAKRRVQLEMRGTEKFEYFDIFQGLLFPPRADTYRIEARRPDSKRVAIERAPLSVAQRQAAMRVTDPTGATEPFWQWRMEGEVAVLTMPTWTTYNSKWDWQSWLNDRLTSLDGARGLVIDLRDNEGGTECGNLILSRLAAKDLRFPGYRELVRFRRTPPDLDRYLETWDRRFRTIGIDATEESGGFLRLPGKGEAIDVVAAMGPRVGVPVAALVSPVCSSATYAFARRAKESGLVRLFGETTGGNLRGINGGAYFFVRLPASGLEFDVPLIGYFPSGPRPDAGVDPDVRVDRTASDIADERDRCLETALAWARTA